MSITYSPQEDTAFRVTIPVALELTRVTFEEEGGRMSVRWKGGFRVLGDCNTSRNYFGSRREALAEARRMAREWAARVR